MALTRYSNSGVVKVTALLPTSLPTCWMGCLCEEPRIGRIRGRLGDRAIQEQCRTMGCRTEAPVSDPLEGSGLCARPRRASSRDRAIRQDEARSRGISRHGGGTVLRGADAVMNPTMPLLDAGEYWLKQIARPDSGLSARTIADYSWTWQKYVDSATSSLRGLTLQQANDPQRLRASCSGSLRHTAPLRRRKPRALCMALSAPPSTTACCLATRRARYGRSPPPPPS